MSQDPIIGEEMSDEDNLRKADHKTKTPKGSRPRDPYNSTGSNDPYNDGADVHEVGGKERKASNRYDTTSPRKHSELKQSAKEREGTSLRKQAKKHKMGVGSFAHHVTTHPGAWDGVLRKKANLSLAMIGKGSSHSKKPTKQRGFEY